MKYLVLFLLMSTLYSTAQIWKEPFDTLPYQYNYLKQDNLAIKSYTVTNYDPKTDTILLYDYFAYNENGLLIESAAGLRPDQDLDTMRYYYDEQGIFRERIRGNMERTWIRSKFLFNERNRIDRILHITIDNDTSTYVRYSYNTNNQLDSIIYSKRVYLFLYDDENKLTRKEIRDDGVLKEHFDYEYPARNGLKYTNCFYKNGGDSHYPCDETTRYENRNGDTKKFIMKDAYDTLNVSIMKCYYDRKHRIKKIKYFEHHGKAETKYIRNKNGLLIRIEHSKNGEVYLYSVLRYELRSQNKP